ncbi:MAG TPA: SMC-Scp complex subunit ScpB [Syntrophomonadaceae bacterium]|nr:SMC-Scp complex subunit ScpB [Syntrophomonadaceae bacterium]
MMMRTEIKGAIEAILFVRSELVPADELVEILGVPLFELYEILRELISEYNEAQRGIQIVAVDHSYMMCSSPDYADILTNMSKTVKQRLSPAAMETLAIIAYQQPVTRLDIEAIRGVRSERIVFNLLERGLIKEVGHKPVVGKPMLYETTSEFLKLFGIGGLEDLPDLEVITHGGKAN